jgi:hypothetical protein
MPLPNGWDGPFQVYESTNTAALPTCPTGTSTAFQGGTNLMMPTTACPACTCGNPSGGTCTATATISNGQGCDSTGACAIGTLTTTCSVLDAGPAGPCSAAMGSTADLEIGVTAMVTGASCEPSASSPPTLPTWGQNVLACSPEGAAAPCDGGICGPSPTTGYKVCISQTAALSCPSPYTNPMTIYTYTDTRMCSNCSCETPQGECSQGKVTFSPNSGCMGDGGVGTYAPMDCTAEYLPGSPQYYAVLTAAPQPTLQPCMPSPRTVSGSVTLSAPTLLCCM